MTPTYFIQIKTLISEGEVTVTGLDKYSEHS